MSTEIVDENGHKLGCPAYRQATFTLCTCGATERAGLPSANTSAAYVPPQERECRDHGKAHEPTCPICGPWVREAARDDHAATMSVRP